MNPQGLSLWCLVLPTLFAILGAATYLVTLASHMWTRYNGKDGQEKLKRWHSQDWGDNTPLSVQLPAFRGYLITQPEHFGPLLKATRFLSNKKVMAELMRDVFGTPPRVMRTLFHILCF